MTGADSVIIYHAGSLAAAFRALADSFARRHPDVGLRLESGGSVDLARRALDSAQTPDVLALADYAVIPRLLMPGHADWYALFARNAMTVVFTDRSKGAAEIGPSNWVDILLRPGVRSGHSDPARDPAGYRARLVFALAERYYQRPGLAASLDSAVPIVGNDGPNALALLQANELDFAIAYRTTARGTGLRGIELPRQVDLSDPTLGAEYANAAIRVGRSGGDTVEIRGEAIQYGVTVPNAARHTALGREFVRMLLGPIGRGVLAAEGFVMPVEPALEGRPPAALGTPEGPLPKPVRSEGGPRAPS
jgi:molybdate/tungstate transport system substrate-binding protein